MTVLLRLATENDLPLMLAWRSIEKVYQGFYTQGRENRSLNWEEHWKWWHTTSDWKHWIIQLNDGQRTRDVGVIALRDLCAWNPEMGIYIGEVSLWGHGVGKKALQLALDWLKERSKSHCRTTVLKSNERAIRLFESSEFKRIGGARDGEWSYQINISNKTGFKE